VICRQDAYGIERVKVFMDWLGALATPVLNPTLTGRAPAGLVSCCRSRS
jgi:hypothetical protein